MKTKIVILGFVCALCIAAAAIPSSAANFKVNDVVDVNTIEHVISKDEVAVVYFLDNDKTVYRASTRDGKIMEIDYKKKGDKHFDVEIGQMFEKNPTGGEMISQTTFEGKAFFTYNMPDETIVRLTVSNGEVVQISWMAKI